MQHLRQFVELKSTPRAKQYTSYSACGAIEEHDWLCATLLTVIRDIDHNTRIDRSGRKRVSSRR